MQSILATYQNGVFTPLEPLQIAEGQQVTIWLEPLSNELSALRPEDRAFLRELAERRATVFQRLAE